VEWRALQARFDWILECSQSWIICRTKKTAKDEPPKNTVKTPATVQDRYPPLPGVKSITPTTGDTSPSACPSAGRKGASPRQFVPKIVPPFSDDKADGRDAREKDDTCHDGVIEGEIIFRSCSAYSLLG
jgi:hypothetical protein